MIRSKITPKSISKYQRNLTKITKNTPFSTQKSHDPLKSLNFGGKNNKLLISVFARFKLILYETNKEVSKMHLSFEHAQIRYNYLKNLIKQLPQGRVSKIVRGDKEYTRVRIKEFRAHPEYNGKYYSTTTLPGSKLLPLVQRFTLAEQELEELKYYLDSCTCPHRVNSRLKRRNEPVSMDREFFEELKKTEDSNPMEKINPIEHNGILMRSKGEALIATKLDELGLEYTYESRVYIGRFVFPDFSVYIPEIDKVFFIEFMGALSDPKYRVNGDFKFTEYGGYGYMNGRDIIYICENDSDKADVDLLETLINALIMANTEVKKR